MSVTMIAASVVSLLCAAYLISSGISRLIAREVHAQLQKK